MRGGASTLARLTIGAVVVALLAAGIPLAWVWVGSQVQGGTSPSATAIATVVTGCMASYGFVALLAAWFKGRSDDAARKARQRALRLEPQPPRRAPDARRRPTSSRTA